MERRTFFTPIDYSQPFPQRTRLPNGTIVVRLADRVRVGRWIAWSYWCYSLHRGSQPSNRQTVDEPRFSMLA